MRANAGRSTAVSRKPATVETKGPLPKSSEGATDHIEPKPSREAAASSQWLFIWFAMLAGLFGALSGVAGKASVTGELSDMVIARVLSFAGNGFCTAQMWRYYLKALSLGSTPTCQIINTGTNFVASAAMGMLLFGETVTPLWWMGAALVVLGLGIITSDPTVPVQ